MPFGICLSIPHLSWTKALSGGAICTDVCLGMWVVAHVCVWTALYTVDRPPGPHSPACYSWVRVQTTAEPLLVREAPAIQFYHAVYSWPRDSRGGTCSLELLLNPTHNLGLDRTEPELIHMIHTPPQAIVSTRSFSSSQHRTPCSSISALLSRRDGPQKSKRSYSLSNESRMISLAGMMSVCPRDSARSSRAPWKCALCLWHRKVTWASWRWCNAAGTKCGGQAFIAI